MRFVSFVKSDRQSYGLLSPEGVLDLVTAAKTAGETLPPCLADFIALGEDGLVTARRLLAAGEPDGFAPLHTLRLLAPIPRPSKNIFCVGRNYHDHVVEGFRAAGKDTQLPQFPQFFTKAPTAVMGPDGDFRYDPALTTKLDYEVELAVVIGKTGCDIARADAMAHIFGVTTINDITARDLQRRHDQWFKGKSLDGSAPMGPCIVTLDEIGDLDTLELTTRVNGEERQRGRVEQLIFDIPEIIAQLSAGLTLEAGDIIATGTPSGVGYAMEPPHFLGQGDVVECEVDRIGKVTTRIVAIGERP